MATQKVVQHGNGGLWGPTLVLQLVQVHELAGSGVEAQGRLPLRLPPLLLLLLPGPPGHLLLQLVQLAALCFKQEEKPSEAVVEVGVGGAQVLRPQTWAGAPPGRTRQLLQDGAAALGLGHRTPGRARHQRPFLWPHLPVGGGTQRKAEFVGWGGAAAPRTEAAGTFLPHLSGLLLFLSLLS